MIRGQMFFGTIHHFVDQFDAEGDPDVITIDFSHSHVWDQSAVVGIAKVVAKYREAGKRAAITGLNEESRILVERVGLTPTGLH